MAEMPTRTWDRNDLQEFQVRGAASQIPGSQLSRGSLPSELADLKRQFSSRKPWFELMAMGSPIINTSKPCCQLKPGIWDAANLTWNSWRPFLSQVLVGISAIWNPLSPKPSFDPVRVRQINGDRIAINESYSDQDQTLLLYSQISRGSWQQGNLKFH